jgi:hypothetical protein
MSEQCCQLAEISVAKHKSFHQRPKFLVDFAEIICQELATLFLRVYLELQFLANKFCHLAIIFYRLFSSRELETKFVLCYVSAHRWQVFAGNKFAGSLFSQFAQSLAIWQ